MIPLLFGCWAFLVALTAAWLWLRATRHPAPAAAKPRDPYAENIDQVRREISRMEHGDI